jgi:hypothetical protein
MAVVEDLLQLEREGWEALSAGGGSVGRFYDQHLASEVLMLLPGGTVIDYRDEAIESMDGSPWASFALCDERVLELGDDCAVVSYRATAEQDGAEPYRALFNSTYVHQNGAWRLAVHQQTQDTPAHAAGRAIGNDCYRRRGGPNATSRTVTTERKGAAEGMR